MTETAMQIEKVMDLLRSGPPRITALTAGLPPAQLRAAPRPGEWSALEVLAHLRSCADMWGGSMVTILTQDHPTIRAINPRTWIQRTDYLTLEFQPMLAAFTAQRAKLLTVLEPLRPEDWARSANITGAGKPLERTVYFYAHWLASHERPHIKQIMQIAEAMKG